MRKSHKFNIAKTKRDKFVNKLITSMLIKMKKCPRMRQNQSDRKHMSLDL